MVRVSGWQLKGRWFKSSHIQKYFIWIKKNAKNSEKSNFQVQSRKKPSSLTNNLKRNFRSRAKITILKIPTTGRSRAKISKKILTTGRSRAKIFKKLLTTGRAQNREETSIATRARGSEGPRRGTPAAARGVMEGYSLETKHEPTTTKNYKHAHHIQRCHTKP